MGRMKRKNESLGMTEEIIGCKWTLRVIDKLHEGVCRPGALKRAIPGISTKVLNERLRKLSRYALIKKKIFPVNPPRVEYSFTAMGKRFIRVIRAIERL